MIDRRIDRQVDLTERPTTFRWTVFVMACGTSWLLYLHRYIFALIKPALIEVWGLDKAQLGLLDSGFALFYTGFQIPLGIATDAIGVHVMLTTMIVVWSFGLALHAWAPGLRELWIARATLGIGQSAVFAAQSKITRVWFPQRVRTTVQGWIGVFFGRFGGLSANLLIGALMLGVLGMPWRTVVYLMAGIGLAHALLFAVMYRDSPHRHPSVNEAEADLIEEVDDKKPDKAADGEALSIGQLIRGLTPRSLLNLIALNVQTILSTVADNIYSAWIPLFLWEVHSLRFKEMGLLSALPLLGGALGGAVGGWLNDRLIARTDSRRWSRTAVGGAGKGLAGVLLLVSLLMYDYPLLFCSMLFFVKFFSDWSLTTTWGAVTDMGGRNSATVFAYNNSVAGIGSIFGPALYGWIALQFGWVPVFVTGAAAYLLCAASWLVINTEIPVSED